MGLNVDIYREEYDNAKLFILKYPINEFTDGKHSLVSEFPHIFLFGKLYKKNVINLSKNDCVNLLMKISTVPESQKILIFYLFDVQRRLNNIRGMYAQCKGNPKEYDKLLR